VRSLAIPSEEDDGKSVSSQGGVEKVLERLDRRLAAIERELDLEREVVHEAVGKRRPLPASPPAAKAAALDGHDEVLRHPIRAVEHEAEHLKDVVAQGDSGATPLILIGTWLAVVLPLVALVTGLAFGISYLVTGSPGTHYPPIPAA